MKQYFKNSKVELLTIIFSLPIIITLLVNYSIACHKYLYRINYDPQLKLCYCQASVTQQNINNQLLKSGYTASVTDTYTLQTIPAFYITNLAYYYIYFPFVNKSSIIFHLTQLPSYIPITNHNMTLNLITFNRNLGGIFIPITTWDTQTQSMRISKFTLDTSPSFQFPIRITFNINNFVELIITFNDNCDDESFAEYNIQYGEPFKDGICIYPYNTNSALYETLSEICNAIDCNAVVDFAINTTQLLRHDLENNVFKSKNPTYCLPDYCMDTQCMGLPLFQTLLLCVSTAASIFTIVNFIIFIVNKKLKHKSHKKEMSKLEKPLLD